MVQAYDTGALAKARKWCERNRMAAALTLIALLGLGLGLIGTCIASA